MQGRPFDFALSKNCVRTDFHPHQEWFSGRPSQVPKSERPGAPRFMGGDLRHPPIGALCGLGALNLAVILAATVLFTNMVLCPLAYRLHPVLPEATPALMPIVMRQCFRRRAPNQFRCSDKIAWLFLHTY